MPDRDIADEVKHAVLPYGRQTIGDEDIDAVARALKDDYLTTGPRVAEFERGFADFCGAEHGVAVNSGTAALHAAMRALGVGPGDEVIVPAITFAASANAAVYEGATPIFADVEADTLLIDPESVARRITPQTKVIVAVDYAGQPADYDALKALARPRGIRLVADACHAPGATYKGAMTGTLADVSCFSFHPVKHLTTGEGGMALTQDGTLAAQMRRFRNHGIDSDHAKREASGTFRYDMVELGYNFRMPDLLCALGTAQLRRLPRWLAARRALAALYREALDGVTTAVPLMLRGDRDHAWHLFVVRLADGIDRDRAFTRLRAQGIGVNVHYAPVHLMTYYRRRGYGPGLCPVAEAAAERILTLPLFPAMDEGDVARVVAAVSGLD